MMIKLELPDDATVGDLITKLFPNMYFTEKHKNIMANYFEDIRIKKDFWNEKLDLESLKDSGIAAEDKHGSGLGTSYGREITIDKTIEIFEGIKEGICPWYPELYCDKAINIMRKYQKIEQIYERFQKDGGYYYDMARLVDSLKEVLENGNVD